MSDHSYSPIDAEAYFEVEILEDHDTMYVSSSEIKTFSRTDMSLNQASGRRACQVVALFYQIFPRFPRLARKLGVSWR
jgi:transcriptional regulator of aromatic amino acid metabolism